MSALSTYANSVGNGVFLHQALDAELVVVCRIGLFESLKHLLYVFLLDPSSVIGDTNLDSAIELAIVDNHFTFYTDVSSSTPA